MASVKFFLNDGTSANINKKCMVSTNIVNTHLWAQLPKHYKIRIIFINFLQIIFNLKQQSCNILFLFCHILKIRMCLICSIWLHIHGAERYLKKDKKNLNFQYDNECENQLNLNKLHCCLTSINTWMKHHFLKLNLDKTEVMEVSVYPNHFLKVFDSFFILVDKDTKLNFKVLSKPQCNLRILNRINCLQTPIIHHPKMSEAFKYLGP